MVTTQKPPLTPLTTTLRALCISLLDFKEREQASSAWHNMQTASLGFGMVAVKSQVPSALLSIAQVLRG